MNAWKTPTRQAVCMANLQRSGTAATLLRTAVLLLILGAILICTPACAASARVPAESPAGPSMMARVPRACAAGGCVFLDIAALREHFQDLYGTYGESFAPLEDYGVNFDDIDRLASASLSLFVLEGRFEPDRIREELGIRDYARTSYLDTEVWERRAIDFADWVALPQGMVVAGSKDSVIECLEAVIEKDGSIYAHRDVCGVIERLPGGVDMSVAATGLDNPLLAHGESLQRINDETLRLTVVHKYVDDVAAEAGAAGMAPDTQELLSQALQEVQVRQEGQFVTLTAEVAPDVICARMTAD